MRELLTDVAPATRWDFVLTCFEPITNVTGGIGTYSRLLLAELTRNAPKERALNVLFITSERQRSQELEELVPDGHVLFVPDVVRLGRNTLNNLQDPYRHFAFGMMRALRGLSAVGHQFSVLEVPDYSAEGYYVLKARKFGLLSVDSVCVRLHSPLFMLHEDNDTMPWCDASAFRFHDMERYCLKHADKVLFGGKAMLERVTSLCPAELAAAVNQKAVEVPHPWPEPRPRLVNRAGKRPFRLGYVGRLEYRKGVDLLVEAALPAMERTPFELHLFGRDTATWRQSSMLAHMQRLITEQPAHARKFFFHDYVPQSQLWAKQLPSMDGFVFPSRFENYPNGLLEVLALGKPTLLSQHGCMPQMAESFDHVKVFDPNDVPAFTEVLTSSVGHKRNFGTAFRAYQSTRNDKTKRMRSAYFKLIDASTPRAPLSRGPKLAISFVVAHYNQSKWLPFLFSSIKREMEPGDEVLVVDDCSAPLEARSAEQLTRAAGFRYLQTPNNGGPSASRGLGLQEAKGDAFYIVDADDELELGSTAVLRHALANDPRLGVVTGMFQAFGDESHAWAAYDPIPETIFLENTTHCGVMARRGIIEGIGGYAVAQREHYEDWELNMRLALSGVPFEVVPIISYRYRVTKKLGRNTSRQHRAGYSYEHAVRRAIEYVDPSRVDWSRLSRLLVSALVRQQFGGPAHASETPKGFREVRYEVADRFNLLVKPTPLHQPLRKLLAWGLDIPLPGH